MRVLYLDVDGVLNIESPSYSTYLWAFKNEFPFYGRMEKHLVYRLGYLCDKCEITDIYISSSWGKEDTVKELTRLDFKHLDKIRDEVWSSSSGERKNVILEHFKTLGEDVKGITLDDIVFGEDDLANLKYITIDPRNGLSDYDVIKAFDFFKCS